MKTVTLTGENGTEFRVLADVVSDWIPARMTREEAQDFWAGCETHIYSVKTGRRLKAYENIMSAYDWKSVAKQLSC